jgi:hypothetical protein
MRISLFLIRGLAILSPSLIPTSLPPPHLNSTEFNPWLSIVSSVHHGFHPSYLTFRRADIHPLSLGREYFRSPTCLLCVCDLLMALFKAYYKRHVFLVTMSHLLPREGRSPQKVTKSLELGVYDESQKAANAPTCY